MKSEEYVENVLEIRNGRVQAALISIVNIILLLFAFAAASRIPEFWAEQGYVQAVVSSLFLVFVAAMMIHNIYTHVQLSRQRQPEPQDNAAYNLPANMTSI